MYGILLPCLGWCPQLLLELLDMLQKRIYRIAGPSLAASLELLASELDQLVPLPFSEGRSTPYTDRLHDFFVTILRYYKDVYVNSFFLGTAKLSNSLPIECFPLTYGLCGFTSRINRHILLVGSF